MIPYRQGRGGEAAHGHHGFYTHNAGLIAAIQNYITMIGVIDLV